jgi:hypothetical protein
VSLRGGTDKTALAKRASNGISDPTCGSEPPDCTSTRANVQRKNTTLRRLNGDTHEQT